MFPSVTLLHEFSHLYDLDKEDSKTYVTDYAYLFRGIVGLPVEKATRNAESYGTSTFVFNRMLTNEH
jgi:hypothetical protein